MPRQQENLLIASSVMDAPTDLRDAVKRNLVADLARSFGRVRLRVNGTSMLPSIWATSLQ
jgi:hypothetical protein